MEFIILVCDTTERCYVDKYTVFSEDKEPEAQAHAMKAGLPSFVIMDNPIKVGIKYFSQVGDDEIYIIKLPINLLKNFTF